MNETWKKQLEGLGAYIREQRRLANLSLRQVAEQTKLSNAYLSQIERGIHEPSIRVLLAVSSALGMSIEALLSHAGVPTTDPEAADDASTTEAAIRNDSRLDEDQKKALLGVYRSFVGS